MPIVKTDTGYWPGYEYKRQVRYTNKDGFTCMLPPEVAKRLGHDLVRGKDSEDCIRNWMRDLEDWKHSNTVVTKVILYRVQRNCYITTRPDIWKEGDHLNWKVTMAEDDISFCEGMAMAITAGVFEEKLTTYPDGRKSYEHDIIKDQLPDSIESGTGRWEYRVQGDPHIKKLPWTPEREEFFRKLARGMESLILMFEKLQDAETTKAIADSGGGFAMLAAPAQEG